MTGDIPKPWYETLDDPAAAALARRLATVFTGLSPGDTVLPYPPQIVNAPGGDVAVVRAGDLAPLWTRYLPVARAAIAAQVELAVEETLGAAPDPPVAPKTPDQQWRDDRGIDVE